MQWFLFDEAETQNFTGERHTWLFTEQFIFALKFQDGYD